MATSTPSIMMRTRPKFAFVGYVNLTLEPENRMPAVEPTVLVKRVGGTVDSLDGIKFHPPV